MDQSDLFKKKRNVMISFAIGALCLVAGFLLFPGHYLLQVSGPVILFAGLAQMLELKFGDGARFVFLGVIGFAGTGVVFFLNPEPDVPRWSYLLVVLLSLFLIVDGIVKMRAFRRDHPRS